MLLLRFAVLSVFEPAQVCAALVAGHAASRFYPVLLMRLLPYARVEGGKSRAFAQGVGNGEVAIAAALAALPVCLLFPARDWLAFLPPFAACAWLGWMFKARIGGYTGDCLGATQQVCEVTIYLSLVALAA
jgi:adenosylcobinamide-GDP ribazoletransferase